MIIKALNANKAHAWDGMSIRMIQLCGNLMTLQLKLLFKTILREETFPEDWKMCVVLAHKKEFKNSSVKWIHLGHFHTIQS